MSKPSLPAPIWPTANPDPVEPFADEASVPDLGWEDHRAAGGNLRREVYDPLARRLVDLLDPIRAGHVELTEEPDSERRSQDRRRDEIVQLLDTLRISRRLTCPHRYIDPPPPWLPSDEDMARVATDLCPTAVSESGDRVLGPLVDELDRARPEHRRAQLVALAAYVFVLADGELDLTQQGLDPGQTPFELWCRRKPIPSVEERACFRAVEWSPWTAWTLVRALGDDRWLLEELVGIDPRRAPTGPVLVRGAAAMIRPPRAGDTMVARVVQGPDGWETRTALIYPGGPPQARIRSWVRLELVRERLRDRALTVDELLRRRGHTLARHLAEWAWRHGDDDPYTMPDLYDLEYRDHDEDLAFYLNQARASASASPILELGCGTGRLSIRLAQAGYEVRGVDLSEAMLGRLAAKAAREPGDVRARLRWHLGDFRTVDAAPEHGLVILPFNAMHHCRSPEELVEVFSAARRALAPGGRFVFDAYLPDLELYDRDPDARYEERTFTDPRTGETLSSWEQGWWDPEARVHHVLYVYEHADGRRETSHLQLRMFELEEIHEALAEAGLKIVRQSQDFGGRPLDEDALKLVVTTRAADTIRP